MTKRRRRKCLNRGMLFRQDPRNLRHQREPLGQLLSQREHGGEPDALGCPNSRIGTTSRVRKKTSTANLWGAKFKSSRHSVVWIGACAVQSTVTG